MPTPKIELHVHLEGTVRPDALIEIARRNGVTLPTNDARELAQLYRFSNFDHFIELWLMTTHALRTEADFRHVVVAYAHEASAHGAVYLEGIFTPAERVGGGASWDEVFSGFCDGAAEARERFGVEIRLTPDISRAFPIDAATETVRYAIKYRDRGVVGVGLGGPEVGFPPEPFAPAFRMAKDAGLGSVPHAGETEGVASIRGAIDALGADRIRHGIRAVDDPALLDELASRGIVCDVCPISNVRLGASASIEEHQLPAMLAAGVACSISTDDPAMFDTDLSQDYAAAGQLGLPARSAFEAGIAGALCDDDTLAVLRRVADSFTWPEEPPGAAAP